jgi:hypothetical protein
MLIAGHTTTALFIHEYILTLPQEIKYIWQRTPSLSAIFFLLNQYTVLLNQGFQLVQAVPLNGRVNSDAERVCFIVLEFLKSKFQLKIPVDVK